ncbi:HPr family phosphocarrier protein [Bifidobacterium callimiconis]|uniref:HPr family phosphocarrier protein n=1 Tax=Bifidobacterium callimiconis TaxID=2306973 RepID=UPI001BDBB627|nr:HPr family phosphocarrier protein [Bifidobacterium callimiconis]MBT1177333.1 HPr family phosphocarrier protein [Bifidobacterium callimiconis]
MLSRSVTVGTPLGLHARPAALFAQAVLESGFDVRIAAADGEADAGSALEIMTLNVDGGDTVTLSIPDDSPEAARALDSLSALLSGNLDVA